MNKEGGELPVTHTGLRTVVQSHADPFLEVPGSGCSGTGVPLPPWASYYPLCSPMSGNTPQPGSQGGFDLRSKAKKWEEEEGESGPVVGSSPWFWGGEPGMAEVLAAFAFPNLRGVSGWVSDPANCCVTACVPCQDAAEGISFTT